MAGYSCMSKTLFTNGCSWTYGGGLDSPDTKEHIEHLHDNIVWPAHVKRAMEFDSQTNLSAGCGSNQRICRTTFDWVMKQDKETLRNTTAIIQWSNNDRFEYYVPKDGDSDIFRIEISEAKFDDVIGNRNTEDHFSSVDARTIDRWAKVNPNGVVSLFEEGPGTKKDAEFSAQHRYRTYTEQEGLYTWLTQLGFLHDLFNRYEIEHYFWFFATNVSIYPQHIQDYIYDSFPFLESGRQHLWVYERIHEIVASSNDCHPSEYGHSQIANQIVNGIAKKKSILRSPCH